MKSPTVITVGSFDGVHLGHRGVLKEIARRARRSARRSLLVTFEPHPLEVVNPPAAPPLLTTNDERREILAQSELDAVAFLPFTKELSRYSPRQFVELLVSRFSLAELVIGHDHGFGRGRAGDEHVLRALGGEFGFAVDVVEPVTVAGRTVSSSLIRRAVAGGDLELAAQLLGRRYACTGLVVPGAGRGRMLGFRTINLTLPDARKLLPPDGVYAVWAEWRTGAAGGMMHMGGRPTFGEVARSLEVHLFTDPGELYGELVKVQWVRRLRDVKKFGSAEELTAQLARDQQAAEAALAVPFAGANG